MSPLVRWTQIGIATLIILVGGGSVGVRTAFAQAHKSPCAAPEFHQFDFWAGDWDVFDVGSPEKVAQVQVGQILDGCVLREDYQGTDGHKGQSFTIYDSARKIWHQSWVTNRGELLIIEGKFEDGALVLRGDDNSKHSLVRGTWKPEKDGVRESAVTSADDGKTWQPWFDLMFRHSGTARGDSKSGEVQSSEEKIVAELDTKYQEAVKNNDVDTMSRILADDFVLVTGSGKRFDKSDLLTEARSGHNRYEHQEDTDRSVRLWGATAVVTANLWVKGVDEGKAFDYHVWFSDTYVKTPAGWRYVFGQASVRSPQGR